MTRLGEIILSGAVVLAMGAVTLSAILFVVGETVEHFTP